MDSNSSTPLEINQLPPNILQKILDLTTKQPNQNMASRLEFCIEISTPLPAAAKTKLIQELSHLRMPKLVNTNVKIQDLILDIDDLDQILNQFGFCPLLKTLQSLEFNIPVLATPEVKQKYKQRLGILFQNCQKLDHLAIFNIEALFEVNQYKILEIMPISLPEFIAKYRNPPMLILNANGENQLNLEEIIGMIAALNKMQNKNFKLSLDARSEVEQNKEFNACKELKIQIQKMVEYHFEEIKIKFISVCDHEWRPHSHLLKFEWNLTNGQSRRINLTVEFL
jgi:hypothetical protein